MPTQRVMIVDDSEADRLFTQIVLERCGCDFEVLAFESAREALAHLAEGTVPVDIVLLDINMPGMDGWAFLDAYAALPPSRREAAALVMLTSSPDPSDRERALGHAMVRGYIVKPIDREQARSLLRFLPGTDVLG